MPRTNKPKKIRAPARYAVGLRFKIPEIKMPDIKIPKVDLPEIKELSLKPKKKKRQSIP